MFVPWHLYRSTVREPVGGRSQELGRFAPPLFEGAVGSFRRGALLFGAVFRTFSASPNRSSV
nr:MAG: hypothetical protein DIU78_02485 [Pseudomonadota bacterium]